MEAITSSVNWLNGIVWGVPMLVLILGVGLFLTVGMKFLSILKIPFGFRLLWQGRIPGGDGEISPFNALMTSLAATIGTGNIAGVATAIFLGGPGAIFWMWMTALVGMATKFAEAVCAVHFREKDERGKYVGGPMYYIKNGLGEKWNWLAVCFALFAGIAGFGIGNMVQANSIANALNTTFAIPEWLTGIALVVLVGAVLLGGIGRIATVAGKLVPIMAIAYMGAGTLVLLLNASAIPNAFALIFTHAFTPTAATGGFAGAAVWAAIRFGVARGVFSNEAGLGSAPIAHAAAQTKGPVSQGLVAMLGTFIDTLIVCSFTALAILCTGAWTSGETGAALTAKAFDLALPGVGGYVIAVALTVFAFTTILGWSYYCERSLQYLFGVKIITPFRVVWSLAALVGATLKLGFVWLLADTLNALMAIPNLIALALLSPIVFKITKEFFDTKGKSENNPF
ncbi:MAG: sodium:alanine symporter family protein [Rhodospirillaceae bacterium]|jgi:alanine or glycine:cation symporter, AGCS family|nr:sodium:alanine symporter family protein [Rhodospirillales bacterium]MBT3906002.1 sodium:alanine symporter family protein [Rhodospirillaceae bacterium]MBT4703836.1 sodium:alanine symporter family protein [Rhodospirillaceae bacterium]MBT5036021.1 sodium:alanine symporter family protein [Rhodospirillaceae bacterium]MBT6220595.1 sodium:alanine symporter family protein [Rhodospirillaceae bacterium]